MVAAAGKKQGCIQDEKKKKNALRINSLERSWDLPEGPRRQRPFILPLGRWFSLISPLSFTDFQVPPPGFLINLLLKKIMDWFFSSCPLLLPPISAERFDKND